MSKNFTCRMNQVMLLKMWEFNDLISVNGMNFGTVKLKVIKLSKFSNIPIPNGLLNCIDEENLNSVTHQQNIKWLYNMSCHIVIK